MKLWLFLSDLKALQEIKPTQENEKRAKSNKQATKTRQAAKNKQPKKQPSRDTTSKNNQEQPQEIQPRARTQATTKTF